MRKIRSAVSLLIVVLIICSQITAFAANGVVLFDVGAVNDDGCFDVTLRMQAVTFRAFQFAVRYDTDILVPVDSNGDPTNDPAEFMEVVAPWLTAIGTEVDAETGYFTFCGFIMPGQQNASIDDNGCYIADANGVDTFVFHFKKIGEGEVAFEIAAFDETKPYNPALPSGGALLGADGDVPASITFNIPSEFGTSTTVPIPTERGYATIEQTAVKNEEDKRNARYNETIILPIGGAYAAVDGIAVAIYHEQPTVTSYLKGDRTFVPVRFVAERLGAEVDWISETQTVIIVKDGIEVKMMIGATTYTINGEPFEMDVPAEFSPETTSRTMVPIRFVAEALNMHVQWDRDTNTAIISPTENPWNLENSFERELLSETMILFTPFITNFIQGGAK